MLEREKNAGLEGAALIHVPVCKSLARTKSVAGFVQGTTKKEEERGKGEKEKGDGLCSRDVFWWRLMSPIVVQLYGGLWSADERISMDLVVTSCPHLLLRAIRASRAHPGSPAEYKTIQNQPTSLHYTRRYVAHVACRNQCLLK